MQKMYMKSWFLIAATVAGLSANAQENFIPKTKRCSSAEVFQQMLKEDLQFGINQAEIERFTERYVASVQSSKTQAVIYTIPVVVHVVYKTSSQNISDAQINSQIDVLNKDFQKLNSDVTKVPSVWTSLVADCQIRFCLATKNPSGGNTTGIIRKSTTKSSFSTNNDVKFSSRGGDDAWDAKKYLNIWVCNLGSGLLGYAQFPGGSVSTDGVVIDYTAFGTNGAAAYPFNLGRTGTHEVGHWLNLRHIWGDDGSGCNGSDQVGDTPNQADEHYGCAKFPAVSCNNGPNGDMFMNYMDYSDDRCMYMFTLGQKSRMHAVLTSGGSRNSVTTSGKCGSTPPSISSQAAQQYVNIVPNPVISGSATIFYDLNTSASVRFIITDMYGNTKQIIQGGIQLAGKHQVVPGDLAKLENGLYHLKMMADDVVLATTQFIVNK
jgi:hypothetical protein